MKEKFQAIDKNGDGNITMKELKSALADVDNADDIM